MMQITSNPTPLAAPAAVSAAQPGDNSQRESRFANLLRQNQAAAPVPVRAATPASEPAPTPPTREANAPNEPDAPAAPAAAEKLRPKVADKTSAPKRAERETNPADDTASPAKAADKVGTERPADTTTTTALDPCLAALQRPADVPAALPRAGGQAAGTRNNDPKAEAITSESGGPADAAFASGGAGRETTLQAEARQPARDAGDPSRPQATASADTNSSLAPLQAAGRRAEEGLPQVQADPTLAPAAQPGNVFAPVTTATRDVAPAVTVHLPTPLASPEFAQALGVQMSVLARGGVQQAELQLNPAEMGPVSVQIVIDGTQARVDFGADMAATRHAIEAGLPELAGALRDAGFTLTGGGVSQHAHGRGDERGQRGEAGHGTRRTTSSESGTEAAAQRVVRRTVAAGGVDLYA